MKVFERKYGGAGRTPGSLHHREPDHGPRRRTEIRHQQKHRPQRLPQFNGALYSQVKEVLEVNKAQRHIRGGIATRKKYRGV